MSFGRPVHIPQDARGFIPELQPDTAGHRPTGANLEGFPLPAVAFRGHIEGHEIDYANTMFAKIAKRQGVDVHTLCARMFSEERIEVALRAFARSQDQSSYQFDWRDGDGIDCRHYTLNFSHIFSNDPENPVRWLMLMIDRTAAVEAERSLRAEMLRDSLTGFPNRTAFVEAIDEAIESDKGNCGFAALVVDLTRFSRVNESMGSLAGDELIITVARRLVSALRGGDVIARLGGDEFGILLRLHEGPGDALHAARRIHSALLTPFRLSDLEIRIDCAIGCALMTDAIGQAEDLVRNAQVALKRAKQSGRVEVYQAGEVTHARRRFSMETELRRAIEAGSLTLAYQPLIDLQSDTLAGFEALARWHHPEHGDIPPGEFVSVAEESGLIVPLGRWAIHEATRALASWDQASDSTLPLYMAVNVSAVQLGRDDIAEVVRRALEITGLHGSRLVLELTESAIIANPERSGKLLTQLKSLETTIAMDDFGTGYSSLAYLQRLPIDVLKIDRSFVSGMLGDRDSVAIVRAILSLATALGMNTTAEGVETAELAHTLSVLGCSYGQGFYFSPPLSETDVLPFCQVRGLIKPDA